jgi:hypothetical protein
VNEAAIGEGVMSQPRPNYRSYLIRFWHMDNAGHPVWRVGVEEPGGQMPLFFESLAALVVYLAEQLGLDEEPPSPDSNEDRGVSGS